MGRLPGGAVEPSGASNWMCKGPVTLLTEIQLSGLRIRNVDAVGSCGNNSDYSACFAWASTCSVIQFTAACVSSGFSSK
jgi:hypothetical protein